MTLALFPLTPFRVQWMSAHCTQISHMGKVLRPVVKLWRGKREITLHPQPHSYATLLSTYSPSTIFNLKTIMWLQKHGTVMGTCMAPSYANLFMGALEEKMLETSPEKPTVWLRYIDDIFFIWPHGRPALETFITHVNNFHHTIKFTSEISPSQIPFLDVMVSLKDGKLQTDLFSKKQTPLTIYTGGLVTHTTQNKASLTV